MPEYDSPADEADARRTADEAPIVIAVVRTGGIAGLRRRWRVVPPPEQKTGWITLVERCPWDAPEPEPPRGADRYVWSIHARVHDEQREQVLPDALLVGAWRELVNAVRDADTARDADAPDRRR